MNFEQVYHIWFSFPVRPAPAKLARAARTAPGQPRLYFGYNSYAVHTAYGRTIPEVILEPNFKVDGKGIDTAALEEELIRRVEERRLAGVYTREVEAMLAERLPDEEDGTALAPVSALDYAATRALASWEVTAAYPVETEKRFIRPFVIFAKRLARVWARVAVGPIQREQTAFNRHVATALEALKRQAVAERAEALAAEADLSALAQAMVGTDEAVEMEAAVAEALAGSGAVTGLGPCPPGMTDALAARGLTVHPVSPGTTWDEGGATPTRTGPLSFLSQVGEESIEAVLVCELTFWLKPEALVLLARRSYLALEPRGRAVIAVHSFAAGPPAPVWCSAEVITRALELAGFEEVSITSLKTGQAAGAPSGFIAVARKR